MLRPKFLEIIFQRNHITVHSWAKVSQMFYMKRELRIINVSLIPKGLHMCIAVPVNSST